MKPIVLVILAGALFMLIASCNEQSNEDITDSVNKQGAIESSISVEHLDSLHDVLITKHSVWTNYNSSKLITYRDTIPALGNEHTIAENENGDTKHVQLKKDYEIFITVK